MLDGQKNLREMLMGIKEIDNVHLDIYGTVKNLSFVKIMLKRWEFQKKSLGMVGLQIYGIR